MESCVGRKMGTGSTLPLTVIGSSVCQLQPQLSAASYLQTWKVEEEVEEVEAVMARVRVRW